MSEPLHVLVWGTAQEGPCAYFRGHMYNDVLLSEHNVEMRHISQVAFRIKKGYEHLARKMPDGSENLERAFIEGRMELDTSDAEWADVVVFRRYYNTAFRCKQSAVDAVTGYFGCTFLTQSLDEAIAHEHGYKTQDDITRMMWPAFRDHWDGAIVYETDDDHWNIKNWNGYYKDVRLEHDLIGEMTRRADLVTVATPVLAQRYGRYNPRIRVVRNAIDPALYQKDTPRPPGDKPRLVYYGSTARMRDYHGAPNERGKHEGGYARAAVEAHRNLLTRVFLGTNPGTEGIMAHYFDEQTPYIEGIAAFSKALANSHGDIGIAPLGGDAFDQAKSELHWLEYAMTDMAFIGQRFNGDGPYSVVRNGVDGLLARGAQEWHDTVGKLARSADLRAQLAGAAKERVLAEYDYRTRAAEWADAFRWAADHAGIGKRTVAA